MWTLLLALPFLVAAGVAFGPYGFFAVPFSVAAVVVLPELRWRRWRYEIRDDEIDIQHGTFTITRTIVPIRRVQHVDSSIGPLQGAFGLASVEFHTAAGATEIEGLAQAEAERVRARVAELARTRDDV